MKIYSRAERDKLASRMQDNREGTGKEQAYVTPNGVVWDYELINQDGGAFWVIREPHHTDAQIEEAKRWIKSDHDVVCIETAILQSEESQAIMASYEVEGLCPDCKKGIPLDVVDGQACLNCGHVFTLPQPANPFPLTEVAIDRDCIVTFGDKDYQLYAGQSFTIMLGKLALTGPAERNGIPTLQQQNYRRGIEAAAAVCHAFMEEFGPKIEGSVAQDCENRVLALLEGSPANVAAEPVNEYAEALKGLQSLRAFFDKMESGAYALDRSQL